MQYTDIVSKVYFLTATNSSSYPAANMLAEINNALDRVVSLILHSDGRWAYDDSNNTDLPIATTDLVQNQQDYSLSVAHLEIARAEIQDANGNWNKLATLDLTDVFNQSLTDFLKTASLPVYYDKIGTSIFLYPKPNYSQAASLKLWIDRGPNYFILGDTTKVPGFNALYHDLCALWPSYNFAMANGRSNAAQLLSEITMREDALKEDYALRAKDDHPRLKTRPYSFR